MNYYHYAEEKLGAEVVRGELKANVTENNQLDEREMSIQICDQLMLHCQELAPATIIFFAPPYYPASTQQKIHWYKS